MSPAPRRILFEISVVGAYAKVAAIDEATGVEVSIVGPASAPRLDLQRLAERKLLARLGEGTSSATSRARKPETTPPGGGGSRLA
ncbi:DUF6898 family protein [Chthonobacter rhizosphaerae]|uniref:DUF6898 family protein n=1 Tax=Chthonobacter rhizosphaerae TaxID=2735553 RepID=UPI0015EEFD9B|nr:serine hydroxymethyltransferase [Chthonobacter rhizosphaerae]